ncbi:hypothetical protein V8F33_009331, partial [Rhypophila sp. PSN 637]
MTNLARQLLGENPFKTFAENCDKTLGEWISLLTKTTLPSNITSSDPRIITAFQAVDNAICNQGSDLLRRLAYIQLNRLFVSLEAIIRSDRENWRVPRKPCQRDATVAIDIYMTAQPGKSNPGNLRRGLKERKRRGRVWSDLARPSSLLVSPLIVLIYSGAAEPIINDHRKMDAATLNLVAAGILKECPANLLSICTSLADKAESAVRSNQPIDMRQIAAEEIRQSL